MKFKHSKLVVFVAAMVLLFSTCFSVFAAPKAGWNQNGATFTLTLANNAEAEKNSYVQFIEDTTLGEGADAYTFKAGIYRIADGVLDTTSKASSTPTTVTVKSVLSDYTEAASKELVVTLAPAKVEGKTITPGIKGFSGKKGNSIYQDGAVMESGYALDGTTMYVVAKGVAGDKFTGVMNSSYVNLTSKAIMDANKKYYKNGELATAVVNLTYYNKGIAQASVSGWKKIGGHVYNFKSGKAQTGWQILASYGGGSTKYKYYFNEDGTLCTNLYAKNYRSWIQKTVLMEVNRTTHNTTLYAKEGSYYVPLLTAICSTSRTADGTKLGTFRLEKTCTKRWFIYKKSTPYHYYQFGVHIKDSASWFHSTMYSTQDAKKLIPTGSAGYNKIGTDQTTACIRHQATVAALIYDIARDYKTHGVTKKTDRVVVKIFKKSTPGPFGKITLNMTTGKISSTTKIDPTDPNFNGFKGHNSLAIDKVTVY